MAAEEEVDEARVGLDQRREVRRIEALGPRRGAEGDEELDLLRQLPMVHGEGREGLRRALREAIVLVWVRVMEGIPDGCDRVYIYLYIGHGSRLWLMTHPT